jgi:shikimate dehydrogenase
VFVPLEVVNLGEFMRRMVRPATREAELNFCGFSVTIPHKRAIIEFLDEVDETAAAIGAVNTVKIRSGKLYGYNTDAAGFIQPLLKMYGDVKGARVASLGAGGGARACVYALKNQGADVTVFARNAEIGKAFAEEFDCSFNEIRTANDGLHNFDILVNATPVGMRGKAKGESPVEAKSLAGLKLVYDLIYTPEKTKLLNDADSLGIKNLGGTEMLLGQAAEQQKIWNN